MDHLALLVLPDLQEEKYSNINISSLLQERSWNIFTLQSAFFLFTGDSRSTRSERRQGKRFISAICTVNSKKISAPFMKISKNSCNYYPLIKYIKLEDPRSWVCARVLPSSVQTTKIIMSSIFTRAPGPPDAKQPKSINDSCIFQSWIQGFSLYTDPST